ncbi:MAG: Holliday junction resolvase RuvX, partial [Propionibacteriaceae bacterium]
ARLALDWGQARIGVAACDREGILAYPVETVRAGAGALPRLVALVAEYEPVEVIVGLPRHLSGAEGQAALLVRNQISELAAALAPRPIRLVDERLTTVSAARQLREAGRDARTSRSVVDQVAAVAILELALQSERRTGKPPGVPLTERTSP